MSPLQLRLGAVAGWLTLDGVLVGLVIVPTAIGGQPVTGTSDARLITAYFAHPEFGVLLALVNAFVIVSTVAFSETMPDRKPSLMWRWSRSRSRSRSTSSSERLRPHL